MAYNSDEIMDVVFRAHLVANKRYLTVEEFANYAGISYGYTRNLIHANKLPTTQLWKNGRTFIDMKRLAERNSQKGISEDGEPV